MSNDKEQAQQKSDEAWAFMQGRYAQIDKIATSGLSNSEEDRLLAQQLAQLVRGEITMRILKSEEK